MILLSKFRSLVILIQLLKESDVFIFIYIIYIIYLSNRIKRLLNLFAMTNSMTNKTK